MLQGARDEREWSLLTEYLDAQTYLESSPDSWSEAARIYFELRRRGRTGRSPTDERELQRDCCIAQLAIADVRPLRQRRL